MTRCNYITVCSCHSTRFCLCRLCFHPLQDNERETRDGVAAGAADVGGVAVGGEQSDGTGEQVGREVEQVGVAQADGDTMHADDVAMHTDDDVKQADSDAHQAVGDEERVGGDGQQADGDGDGEQVDDSAVSGVDDETNAAETVAPPVPAVPIATEWRVKSDAIARRLSQIHEVCVCHNLTSTCTRLQVSDCASCHARFYINQGRITCTLHRSMQWLCTFCHYFDH